MESPRSSETSGIYHITTRRQSPEDDDLYEKTTQILLIQFPYINYCTHYLRKWPISHAIEVNYIYNVWATEHPDVTLYTEGKNILLHSACSKEMRVLQIVFSKLLSSSQKLTSKECSFRWTQWWKARRTFSKMISRYVPRGEFMT